MPEAAEAAVVGLDERLRQAAGADGWLPFDRFMELALYAPGVGYYASPGRRLGAGGDFYTAAHVSPLFARALAERLWAEFERQDRPEGFLLVELGPGDGTLMGDLVAHLDGRRGFERWELVLADRAIELRESAARRVRAAAAAAKLRTVSGLSELGAFRGVLVANELLDALPARRFVVQDGRWRERGVRSEGGRWLWADRPRERGPAGIDEAGRPDALVVEVAVGLPGLMREVADRLVDGVACFLDYGMERAELSRAHPHGTLQAVRSHRAAPDPLADPGAQDLSCFVDFTALRHAAEGAGLDLLADRSQAEALVDWGLPALLQAAQAAESSAEGRVRLGLAAKNLLMGFERFRAFEWRPAGKPSGTPGRQN